MGSASEAGSITRHDYDRDDDQESSYLSRLPNMGISNLQQHHKTQANPSSESEKSWAGDFTFIQAADTQFGMIDELMKRPKEACDWTKEVELATEMVQNINRMRPKPRFLVICGDMLDSFPYEGEKTRTREKQYADFVKVFQNLDPSIKLVCVCGNHDVGNEPTDETLAIYRKQFGPDFFSFWTGGVKFIVLNSQYFMWPERLKPQHEVKRQQEFMKTIHDSTAKHIVVFQHIPYFVTDPNEIDSRHKANVPKEMRLKLLGQLKSSGVGYIFSGHFDRNAGGFFEGMEQIVTSAVGAQFGHKDRCGYRIVNVTEENITHKYVELSKNYNCYVKSDLLPDD